MASTATKPKKAAKKPLIAWKGFDANLACLGHQFEVGKSYSVSGKVAACQNGFHACESPLDVWAYYYPDGSNRFCRVQLSGALDRHGGDSKIAAETILIETEVNLGEMIKAGVKYEIGAAFKAAKDTSGARNASSGDSARNASSGYGARNASSGDNARNASSGNSATNASSGYNATNASSGNSATNASSGYGARNASSGDNARNASSGNSATNASSGYNARNASSGNSATNASSGDYARNASSGNSATNASSGDYARNASSGDNARNAATGKKSVIASAGLNSSAKGAKGTAIALPYDDNGQIRFVCGVAGEDGVPADTWLVAKAGKLVAA